MISYIRSGVTAVTDLVLSKEFFKGLVLGSVIMAGAVAVHVLVRL